MTGICAFRRIVAGGWALAVLAGCSVAPKVVDYKSFQDQSFSRRSRPAEIQARSTADLLGDGYLLLGYIDLRRNVQTCYEDDKCVQHSDALPPPTELQEEAARRGGDVVTLLEDRTVLEATTRSDCTATSITTTTVNGYPVTTTNCTAYKTVKGKLEAKISRALIWRLEPDAAAGEANARAIEMAMATLDEAAARRDTRGSTGLEAVVDTLLGGKERKQKAAADAADAVTSRLLTAIATNDREALTSLAKDGTLARWTDPEGHTALMVAIGTRHPDAAGTLASLDAGVGRLDNRKNDALFYAVLLADQPLVEQLVKAGYNPRVRPAAGVPLLFIALANPDGAVYDWLLAQGLNPAERDVNDATLLMAAAEFGRTSALQKLLAAGFDPNHRATDGTTPLMAAARGGQAETFQVLLKARARSDATDGNRRTALHYGAAGGNLQVIETLLGLGLGLGAEDADGRMPFTEAVAAEQWAAADLLMDRGTPLRTSRYDYGAVAGALVLKNQPRLLDRYARLVPDLLPAMRADPAWLHLAAGNSGPEVVNYLLDQGANVDGLAPGRMSPLMTAAAAGNTATARALLARKADATLRDRQGHTALMLATQNDHAEVVAALREFGVAQ